jgi:hypothetical protein
MLEDVAHGQELLNIIESPHRTAADITRMQHILNSSDDIATDMLLDILRDASGASDQQIRRRTHLNNNQQSDRNTRRRME